VLTWREHRIDAAGAACNPKGSAGRSDPTLRCRSVRGPPVAALRRPAFKSAMLNSASSENCSHGKTQSLPLVASLWIAAHLAQNKCKWPKKRRLEPLSEEIMRQVRVTWVTSRRGFFRHGTIFAISVPPDTNMATTPTVNTIIVADHIWRGQGKTHIIGIFDELRVPQLNPTYSQEICIYIAVADVASDTTAKLSITHLESDHSVFIHDVPVPKSEKLSQSHLIIPVPENTLDFPFEGIYAIDICFEDIAIKTLRINVLHNT